MDAEASPICTPCLQTANSSQARHQTAITGCDPARILPRACTVREGRAQLLHRLLSKEPDPLYVFIPR